MRFLNAVARGYPYVFARPRFQKLNRFLFECAARGLGILNYENGTVSGENYFLKKILTGNTRPVVIDIGANEGVYAEAVRRFHPNATVFALEPHPETFKRLARRAEQLGFIAVNVGCGRNSEKRILFDYKNSDGTVHASLYEDVITSFHQSEAAQVQIEIVTVDEFLDQRGIGDVDLLKIDTEGNEFDVLLGAEKALNGNRIRVIHFEFNEMNVISRVFLRDFSKLLSGYRLFRLLPKGVISLEYYHRPLLAEIFGFQNIVAIRKDLPVLL